MMNYQFYPFFSEIPHENEIVLSQRAVQANPLNSLLIRHMTPHRALGYTQQLFEPRSEKTGLRGIRPGPTQTKLLSHRR